MRLIVSLGWLSGCQALWKLSNYAFDFAGSEVDAVPYELYGFRIGSSFVEIALGDYAYSLLNVEGKEEGSHCLRKHIRRPPLNATKSTRLVARLERERRARKTQREEELKALALARFQARRQIHEAKCGTTRTSYEQRMACSKAKFDDLAAFEATENMQLELHYELPIERPALFCDLSNERWTDEDLICESVANRTANEQTIILLIPKAGKEEDATRPARQYPTEDAWTQGGDDQMLNGLRWSVENNPDYIVFVFVFEHSWTGFLNI